MTKTTDSEREKIKNGDLYRFREGFDSLANAEAPVEFSYKLIKNLKLIEAEITVFDELLKPSKDYSEKYQPKVEEIAKEFCIKDKDGNIMPKMGPNGAPMYDFDAENKEKFDAAIDVLEKDEANALLIKERKAQVDKYNELMKQDSTVSFIKIPMKILPPKITPRQLNLIFELVSE